MRSRDRVAVGWIDGGQVDGLFCVSLMNLFAERKERISTAIRIGGSLLSRQRNELVVQFLDDTDADWLLILDSDETITPAVFDKLIAAAHDTARPIVAGIYFAAWESGGPHPRPLPMVLRVNDRGSYDAVDDLPEDDVIPIDAAGTGCLLIHRGVLQTMRDASNAGPLAQHEAGKWCWFRDMPVAGEWFGEDVYFCRRARDMGFPIVAATGARLGHHKDYWVTDVQYQAWRRDNDATRVTTPPRDTADHRPMQHR